MKTNSSFVPQVCKFGGHVILMSGLMHLMCFCNLLVLLLFLYFLFFCLKYNIYVIKGNKFYYTRGYAFQSPSVTRDPKREASRRFFSIYGHCQSSVGSLRVMSEKHNFQNMR